MRYCFLILLICFSCSKSEQLPEVSLKEFIDQNFTDMNIRSESFKVIDKKCENRTCFLTYTLEYTTKAQNEAQFVSVVKKIAEMKLIQEKWLINKVSDMETTHEGLIPIKIK